ncbi:putative ribonuclease H-like domain-containing protein [Tanacetum coccineum]
MWNEIIFGSTKKELCIAFKKLMHEKFQMSSMGELTFFLGLQVKQNKDDIFISQDKYAEEILKKFRFTEVKTERAHHRQLKAMPQNEDGEEWIVLYDTSQSKVSQSHDVKRIFSVQNVDEEVFDVNVLDGEEMFVAEQEVADNKENAAGNVVSIAGNATTVSFATTTTATITIVDDITLAQAHMEIKSTKPKEKRVVIQELGESTKIISSQLSSQQSQDKGK